jgi:tetratricopeptide (TPR) repeat protein
MSDTRSLDNPPGGSTVVIDPVSPPEARIAVDDCLGRYTVRAYLGSGGMGEVFEGYDPELERPVALKILKAGYGGSSPEARARFQREAQAMARLNHPNVVAVYDVGTIGEQVFVAMELVRGPTLAAWIAERAHPWREVVEVFLAAGRGLEAAHAAGIVHRDFKPQNVILGERVRVADFGLARLFGEAETGGATASTLLASTVTQTGQALGTPAYMAPEQRQGGVVSAQADQYAFCVALAEALGGARLPRSLAALIARGRSVDPAQRYPSMRALLADLGRDLSRARRRVAYGAGVLLLLGAAMVAWGRASSPCASAQARLAGIWDAARKDGLRGAFAAAGLSYGDETWQRVSARLDDYAAHWVDMANETCRATRVEGRQSDSLMDLRMACLDWRRGVLGGLVDLWSRGVDADGLEHADEAALELPDLAECADVRALGERAPLPANAAAQEMIAQARAQVGEVRTLTLAHRWPEAKAKVGAARAAAEATGWLPVRAEAAFAEADVLYNLVDARAAAQLVEAARIAGEAHDDRTQGQALVQLVNHLAGDGQHAQRALDVADVAEGVVVRVGDDHILKAKLLRARAEALLVAGKPDGARALLVQARALSHAGEAEALAANERIASIAADQGKYAEAQQLAESNLAATIALRGPDHPRVAAVLVILGNTMAGAGDNDAAARHYRRALAIMEKAAGPDAPPTAQILGNLGSIEMRRGHYDEARSALERALAIEERTLGPESGLVARALQNLALVRRIQGQRDAAIQMFERAIAIKTKVYGAESAQLISPLVNLANTFELEGDSARALSHYQRAVDMAKKSLGAEHPKALGIIGFHGLALARLHRCAEARPLLVTATAGLEKSAPDQPDLAQALTGSALCDLDANHAAAAAARLERALTILDKAEAGPDDHGFARWVEARALWSLGQRDQALTAAQKAERELATNADAATDLAELRAWLRRTVARAPE